MKWVTRENANVDRVACPWLIKRFIDPQAAVLAESSGEPAVAAAAACRAWTAVASPTVDGGLLRDVSAVSPRDIWAVGDDGFSPFFEHWNGVRWSEFGLGFQGTLYSLSALAAEDAWAVG